MYVQYSVCVWCVYMCVCLCVFARGESVACARGGSVVEVRWKCGGTAVEVCVGVREKKSVCGACLRACVHVYV